MVIVNNNATGYLIHQNAYDRKIILQSNDWTFEKLKYFFSAKAWLSHIRPCTFSIGGVLVQAKMNTLDHIARKLEVTGVRSKCNEGTRAY